MRATNEAPGWTSKFRALIGAVDAELHDGTGQPDLRCGRSTPTPQIQADPSARLSVQSLAAAAGMSRAPFFDRFHREVGSAPMKYVAAWRMAVAKDMLLGGNVGMADRARRVGYGAGSAFSMAFSRWVGTPSRAFAAER